MAPLIPFQVGIRLIKNLGVHPPKIKDFYQQFMGSLHLLQKRPSIEMICEEFRP